MKLPKGLLSVLALIAANLYPLAGVLFWNWDPTAILMLYWMENLVFGFFTILKMAVVPNVVPFEAAQSGFGRSSSSSDKKVHIVETNAQIRHRAIGAFCGSYGFFCFVHGLFVVMLIALWHGGAFSHGGTKQHPDFSVFPGLLRQLLLPVLCLFVSHGFSFVEYHLIGGERQRITLEQIFHQPFSRMVNLHLGLLGGMFIAMLLGGGLSGVVAVLIVLKILFDLRLHIRSHRPPS